MKFVAVLFLLLGTTAFGQADVVAQDMLYNFVQKADAITIYSIDPTSAEEHPTPPPKDAKPPAVEKFRGYTVFGKIVTTPADLRERVRNLMISALVSPDETYECFSPRIGVSLMYQGKQLDILMCYQCHQSRFFMGEEWDEGPLGNAGETEFNAIFDQRGIKRDVPKPRPTPVPN